MNLKNPFECFLFYKFLFSGEGINIFIHHIFFSSVLLTILFISIPKCLLAKSNILITLRVCVYPLLFFLWVLFIWQQHTPCVKFVRNCFLFCFVLVLFLVFYPPKTVHHFLFLINKFGTSHSNTMRGWGNSRLS